MKQHLRSLWTLLLLMMWCSVGFAAAGDNFTLVTAESELKAGDVIIIVNQEEKKALSTSQKKKNRSATPVTISGNNVTSSGETQEITLEGVSGAWYFNVGNGYLYAASSSENQLKTQSNKNNNSKASITFDNSKELTIKFLGTNSHNTLQYNPNNGAPLFTCYASASQKAISIYKKAATKTLTSLAISGEPTKKAYNDGEAFDPTGLVVTGTYDDASTATITDGITWTKTPETLTVGTTSCSVTATVNSVTSPAYNVTGLTVTKTIPLTIEPATSTVVKAPVKVTLNADGATIYYTTNGNEPTRTSTKYTEPFEVTKSGTTVKALAVAEGAEDTKAEITYTIKPDQPVFSDESKDFNDVFDVTLSLPESTDATSTIRYAINATATAKSPLYEGPINISAEKDGDKVVLHAVVVDQYGNVGKEKYCTYTKTTAIVFDFTGDWEGIIPSSNNTDETAANVVAGKELKVDGIVMTATNGEDNTTCLIGNSDSHELRVYKNGGSITFTAPEGYNISYIKFNNSSASFTPNEGNYASGTWTGNAKKVTFNASATVKLKNATIKLVATTLPLNETTTAEDARKILKANLNKTVDVTINRTLVANKWNTLCLPFDVTAEQIKNILKAEGMVREYADEDVTNQTIIFKKVEGNMIAGVPYLIKPTEDITSLAFEGVTITETEGNCKGNIYSIWGTFGKYAMKTDGTELFLNAAGKFVAPAEATNKIRGFRAYFMVPKGSSAAALNINIDGETTGINNIETNATVNGKVYNLNGQYVGNSLNGLKKGIYVVNGKKVIK